MFLVQRPLNANHDEPDIDRRDPFFGWRQWFDLEIQRVVASSEFLFKRIAIRLPILPVVRFASELPIVNLEGDAGAAGIKVERPIHGQFERQPVVTRDFDLQRPRDLRRRVETQSLRVALPIRPVVDSGPR